MEYSTKDGQGQLVDGPRSCRFEEAQDWEQAVKGLSADLDLDATARTSGALLRRRKVKRAADLLRMILAYCVCDWSLRLVGAWFALLGLGQLSKTAIRQRLRHSATWLGTIIVAILRKRNLQLRSQQGVRLRLIDATVVSKPGSQGTDWRVHLSLDLGSLCLDGIEVTDAHGGETLARFPTRPGDIWVGDRGYAFAKGLGPILAAAAWLVVRINWQNLPLQDEQGHKLDLIAWLRRAFATPLSEPQTRDVWLQTPKGRFGLRLVACPLPQEAAETARQRARKAARKKGRTVDERTLFAAGFVLIITNLPADRWNPADVSTLYRARWQIEILIKRLKSLLILDGLRAQDPALAQTYLLGKLLAALMLDEMIHASAHRCPDWFSSTNRPISVGRLTTLFTEGLRTLVGGIITWSMIRAALPQLQRFLCDEPRKRRSQLACARALLQGLSSCQSTVKCPTAP